MAYQDSARQYGDHDALLLALTAIDERYIATHPATPRLADAGIVEERRVGETEMCDVGVVLARRRGDVEELCSWRCAELRASGEDPEARPVLAIRRAADGGVRYYTVIVARGDGRIETWDGRDGDR